MDNDVVNYTPEPSPGPSTVAKFGPDVEPEPSEDDVNRVSHMRVEPTATEEKGRRVASSLSSSAMKGDPIM